MSKVSGIRATTSDSMASPLNQPEVSTPHAIDTCSSLVDSHVSQLMDDLFQGLNEELGEATLISPQQVSQSSARRSPASSSSSLATLLPRSKALEDSLLVPFVELGALLDPLPTGPAIQTHEQEERSRQNLWLGVSCTAFIGSLGLWGLSLWLRPTPQPVVAQAVSQAAVPVNPANIAFATELAEALHRAEQASTVTAVAPTASAPKVAFSQIRPATAPSQLPLQPVQGRKATLPAKPTAKLSPPVLPQGATKPPSATRTVAMSALEGRLPQLTPNQSPPASLSASSPVTPVASQTLPVANQGKAGVTVQGILDLGEQSAMLISRNGSSQNVRLGEALDATGWTFVRVEQGQAIIQRGNEVRSVNSGEQF